MYRFVSCTDQDGRSVVTRKSLTSLLGALTLGLAVAGCQQDPPKSGPSPATTTTSATTTSETPHESLAKSDETAEKPSDNPADIAALKAAGATLRSAGGSVVLVDLSDQNGTDEILLHLKGLPALKTLILAGHSYSPEGLARLGEVPQLKRLELEATRTNDSVLAALKPLVNLELM